ncbi:hypothetical protein N0V88_006259 [Collariella sp. IMI 366227]|nr:hypothetical protein N0V88_006259 [Collariella sp. IMI 366227]
MATPTPTAAPKPLDPAYVAESNTVMIVTVVTIFHFLALIFVSLRIYARAVVIKTFGRDDICMVLSAADNMIISHANFWQSIISTTWSFFMGMMTFLLRCFPMQGYWDKTIGPKCYDIQIFVKFSLVNTGFNIFTDVLFATFPVPIIWSLKMKRKLKFYLIGILSLGYFAVALGIVKSVYQIAYATQVDKTFRQSIHLQLNVGIIAACATSLKPLVSRILSLNSTDRYNNTPGQYASRYGYGKSRGTKLTSARDGGTVTGGHPGGASGIFAGPRADEYELENNIRTSGEDGTISNKTDVYSTTTSFYKHGSADGSGSEEMILKENGVSMPPTVATADEAARGIVRKTEVRVNVTSK